MRVAAPENPLARLLKQHVRGQGKNLLPRRHDLSHRNVAEFQRPVHQRLLKLRQNPQPPRRRGDQLQFLGRVNLRGAFRGRNIERAQHHCRRATEQSHGGARDRHKNEHGRCNAHGQCLRAPQGERLRYQLTRHNVKIGDDGEAERHSCHVAVDIGVGQYAHPTRQYLRGQRFAQPSQRQRAKRHAKLHRGQQIVQVALQGLYRPRSRHPRGQQLFHARVANGDQREFHCDKIRVGQDQHGHRHRLDKQELVHLGQRIALQA